MRSFWGMLVAGCLGTCIVCPGQNANSISVDSIRGYEVPVSQAAAANDGATLWKLAMQYQALARYKEAERAYS
ncbi:MAG TPA: hypothetical protein VGI45_22440 [Terracidiphilus sp.]|jgi:hypothetical protein